MAKELRLIHPDLAAKALIIAFCLGMIAGASLFGAGVWLYG